MAAAASLPVPAPPAPPLPPLPLVAVEVGSCETEVDEEKAGKCTRATRACDAAVAAVTAVVVHGDSPTAAAVAASLTPPPPPPLPLPSPLPSTRRGVCVCCCGRWRLHYAVVVAAITFVAVFAAGGVSATPALLTVPFETEFGWSRSQISGAVAINVLLFGVVGPFAVAAMNAVGMKRCLLAALVTLGTCMALMPSMTALWHFYCLCGLLVGFASGFAAPVLGKVVVNRWFVRRGGLVMGVLSASMQSGRVVLAPALGALTEHAGWRAAAYAMAGVIAVVLLPTAVLLVDYPSDVAALPYGAEATPQPPPPPPPPPAAPPSPLASTAVMPVLLGDGQPLGEREEPGTPPAAPAPSAPPGAPQAPAGTRSTFAAPLVALASLVRHSNFALLAGSFFVCGFSTVGLIGTHLVPACMDHGMAETAAASFLAGIGVFDIAGTVGSGMLSDRYDNRALLAAYYGFRGVALVFLPWAFVYEYAGLWPFAIVYGLDWIATVPPTAALCTQCFGAHSATAFAWALAAHQVGAAVAAAGAGAVRVAFGSYNLAFWVSGGLCLVTALAVTRIRPPLTPPSSLVPHARGTAAPARLPSLSLRRLLW